MITGIEILKTLVLGFAIVVTFRMLKPKKKWNEIELVGRKYL